MAENDDKQSIQDIVGAAFDEANGIGRPEAPERQEAPERPEAPEGETAEQRADRERDEKGRFAKVEAKAERPTLKLKPKADKAPQAAVSAAPVESQPATPAAKLAPEIDKDGKHLDRIPPPAAWKGSAKINWDHLPRPVREEITAKYAEVDQVSAEMAPLKELFDTNREFLVNQAGSVVEAQRQMMQFARMSVDNPVQLAEHILRARGLDPRAVFSGQPGQAPAQNQPQDPQALVAQLVRQELQQQSQQQQSQQLSTEIATFAADPAHPYFNDVRTHMSALLNTGAAKTLQDAYEQAVWANPTIRAQLQAEEREAEAAKRAEDAAKAKQALKASVRGSPLPNGSTKPNGALGQSAFDTARQAYDEVLGA